MPGDIHLDRLSVAEKVQLLERVWDSLCSQPADVTSPDWHREVLQARGRRLADGRATVADWTDAKVRLQQLGQ